MEKKWKNISLNARKGETYFQFFNRLVFRFFTLALIFMCTPDILQSMGTQVVFADPAETLPSANGSNGKTKEEQSRQILIEIDRLKMELAENLMKK
ncbi:MAG: hypothetical protein OXI63_26450, partial [Candidatus Poribacteria bacterium]|nr:hypothetical protein [Candidatus Poribacteria bacterium]